jgi:hypothetical protein
LEIRYTAKPRAYWLRAPEEYLRDEAGEWSRSYPMPGWSWEDLFAEVDEDGWVQATSVTTVLECLDKPLSWWGMKIGIAGVIELVLKDKLNDGWFQQNGPSEHAVDAIAKMLTAEKLTVNHIRDKGGEKGQTAHDAFEAWVEHGVKPHPPAYPTVEQGYLVGLRKFMDAARIETVASEQMVGSWQFLFAGRYDWDGRLWGEFPNRLPSAKGKAKITTSTWNGERTLLDLKTSKGVYPTHHIQLEGYEGGRLECGYDPTERRAVVHVTADGNYQVVENTAVTYDHFLAVRAVDNALRRIK